LYNKEKTPSDYSEIEIGFNFEYTSQLSSISFERQIGPNTRVRIWNRYTYKDRTLKKSVRVVLKKADIETYWCSIYDSKYSPSNYGDVKVETQWENW